MHSACESLEHMEELLNLSVNRGSPLTQKYFEA